MRLLRPLPIAFLISTLLGLGACSSISLARLDPAPEAARCAPPEGLGQLCVLRTRPIAIAVTIAVRDNGALVGATRGTSWFCYLTEPGWHRLESKIDDPGALEGPSRLEYHVNAGDRLYLHQVMGMFGHRLEWLSQKDAVALLDRVDYQVIKGSDEASPGPMPIARALRPPAN